MIINESDHYNHTHNPIQKQGFFSILNTTTPDFNSLSSSLISHPPPNYYSIRRTFSTDMLALNQNGFSLKRAQSSEQLDFLGKNDDDRDDHDNQEMNKNSCFRDEKRGAFEDIWSSIQKNGGSGSVSGGLPPPYVHPLVRKSASLLSQRSLEICTESLGSETGSETGLNGLSYRASDLGGSDKDGEGHADHLEQEESTVIKINCAVIEDDHQQVGTTKFLSVRRTSSSPPAVVPMARSSFPPPLPSLSHRGGSNLHMRSHRRDGRLVVEAVAVPSVNRLRVQRHDGRLLLTLTADDDKAEDEPIIDGEEDDHRCDGGEQQALLDEDGPNKENDYHEDEDQEGQEDEEEEETELEKELAIVMEAKTSSFKTSSSSSLIMSKLMELMSTKNKSVWPRNFNATIVKTLEDGATLAKSQLPPRPVRLISAAPGTTSTTTVLNAYEYYWRHGKGNTVAVLKPLAGQKNNAGATHAGPQVVKDAYINKLLLAHKGKPQEAGGEREVVLVKAADGVEVEKGGLKAAEYLVPMLRGCKEPRKRSLLLWDSEPYCIATS